ncbi:MAG: 30S ribosomal protein S6 [Actinomycetota bacterium]|nr:30S ribosomal protein S6 [Actinomycetota bacterium]
MEQYEIMVIVDPESDESQLTAVVDRITGIVDGAGGEVAKVDRWGRRKLAYEIDRKSEGSYLVIAFRSGGDALKELDRVLSLADPVMRFKVVRKAA